MLVAFTASAVAVAQPADVVLRNGKVVTLDHELGVVEALAIRDERVVAAGSNTSVAPLISEHTQTIDLGGRTVIPGLIDSHLHVTMGAASERAVSLSGVRSIADIQSRIAKRAGQLPQGEWIVSGAGWHESQIAEGRLPNRFELDTAAPKHPVLVARGGHVAVANSKALALAGIDRDTADPPGGVIVRDTNGEPSGVLVEPSATALVRNLLPAPTADERRRSVAQYLARLPAAGITSILDPGIGVADLDTYRELHSQGKLSTRITALLWARTAAELDANARIISSFSNDDRLRVIGCKAGVDGGIEGAYLNEPYRIVPGEQDNPSYRGKLLLPPGGEDELQDMLLEASRRKLQMQIHAVGDAALERLVDLVGEVDRQTSIAGLRWAVVHAFLPAAPTLRRMRELDLYVAVQDHPVTLGHNMVRYWGEERAARAIPLRSMLDAGLHVAAGTDAPVVDHNPFVAIAWMVRRATLPEGVVLGAEQAIGREEALRLYTLGSARLLGVDDDRGSLAPGKLADLVVLSADLLSVPANEISRIRSIMTLIDGQVVHADASFTYKER